MTDDWKPTTPEGSYNGGSSRCSVGSRTDREDTKRRRSGVREADTPVLISASFGSAPRVAPCSREASGQEVRRLCIFAGARCDRTVAHGFVKLGLPPPK